MQLILASSSKTRKKILRSLGVDFRILPSRVDETKITASNPKLLAQKIAKAKAEAVAKMIKEKSLRETVAPQVYESLKRNFLIIAADSMVVLGSPTSPKSKTIGKPKDQKEAKKILKMLSGKTHWFITAVYVVATKDNKTWQKFAQTKVTFKNLSEKEIDEYVQKTKVTRFAGGYTIASLWDFSHQRAKKRQTKIIQKIEGSLTNVLGLPLELLLPILKETKIKT